MRESYVYYRIALADRGPAAAAVRQFQATLCSRHPALRARLLARPAPTAEGEVTWMETYSLDPSRQPAGVGAELQAEIEVAAGALAPWLRGPRHVEVFTPVV